MSGGRPRGFDVKVVMLFNPSSGGGRREREVARLSEVAVADGHEVATVRIGPGFGQGAVRGALAGAGALVIAGGDGTLHHALDEAVRAQVPVYHVPMGTENLFARQFGMTRSGATLRRLLGEPRIIRVDVGECNGRLFALMCSVGPDAGVIHRLAAARRGSISHGAYVRPICSEFRRRPARVWAALDGEVVVDGRRGMLVVANSRQYAMRMDPAVQASMTDGLLDVVFLPAEGNARTLLWLLQSRLRRHLGSGECVYATGQRVRVEVDDAEGPVCVQADGEPLAMLGGNGAAWGALEIGVRPGALGVLAPA